MVDYEFLWRCSHAYNSKLDACVSCPRANDGGKIGAVLNSVNLINYEKNTAGSYAAVDNMRYGIRKCCIDVYIKFVPCDRRTF